MIPAAASLSGAVLDAHAVRSKTRVRGESARAEEPAPDVAYYKFKLCVVGDSAVGKTSLIRRYVFGTFDPRGAPTAEVQVSSRGSFVDLSYLGLTLATRRAPAAPEPPSDSVRVDLLLWDILGDTLPKRAIHEEQYAGARGVVAVCDLTRPKTLDSLDTWIEDVYDVAGPVPTIVVANKLDLLESAALREEDIARAAWAFDSPYVLASAKTGFNVERGFQSLAETIAKTVLRKRSRRRSA